MSLPREYLFSLADQYFKETQSWFPIINREHIRTALEELPTPVTHIDDIVLRAMTALQLSYSSQAICLGYHGRFRLSQYLRSQVLNEALSKATLSSVQSLLVIAMLDYGADNIPSTFSLMSVCRRMCENIGLFRKLLSQMEHQSPTQIGPPALASDKTGDELAIPITWATLALDATTTLGVSWRDVSAALVDHLSSVAYVSAPDLKDTYRTHAHLAAIALQPLHIHPRARTVSIRELKRRGARGVRRNIQQLAKLRASTAQVELHHAGRWTDRLRSESNAHHSPITCQRHCSIPTTTALRPRHHLSRLRRSSPPTMPTSL